MYAHRRTSCSSDAARLFVKTVIETLEEERIRKYARRGGLAAKFAKTVEGLLGDLMLARMHPAAAGWVFRPWITVTSRVLEPRTLILRGCVPTLNFSG